MVVIQLQVHPGLRQAMFLHLPWAVICRLFNSFYGKWMKMAHFAAG
jgi:hypothetical protein